MGYDLAGEVVAVGSSVKNFKVGDEIYSRIPEVYHGSLAQYCLTDDASACLKPESLSFTDAAAIPLAGLTALQALDIGEKSVSGGLKGKTVLVPGGLSGTGSFAVQLAKNCFGAGKVITTLSTGKIAKIGGLLGQGAPDQCVDYTKNNVVKDIGEHTVDFMFDTQRYTFSAPNVMKEGGQIVSISTIPNGTSFKMKNTGVPVWLEYVMNFVDWVLTSWMSWKGIGYRYMVMRSSGEDLERLAKWVEEGKVKSVVGECVKLSDIGAVRENCQRILDGKGGVGKFVVEID
jgi:NADPH:quinone reductase-like Zn-dependent oxidoreductase